MARTSIPHNFGNNQHVEYTAGRNFARCRRPRMSDWSDCLSGRSLLNRYIHKPCVPWARSHVGSVQYIFRYSMKRLSFVLQVNGRWISWILTRFANHIQLHGIDVTSSIRGIYAFPRPLSLLASIAAHILIFFACQLMVRFQAAWELLTRPKHMPNSWMTYRGNSEWCSSNWNSIGFIHSSKCSGRTSFSLSSATYHLAKVAFRHMYTSWLSGLRWLYPQISEQLETAFIDHGWLLSTCRTMFRWPVWVAEPPVSRMGWNSTRCRIGNFARMHFSEPISPQYLIDWLNHSYRGHGLLYRCFGRSAK